MFCYGIGYTKRIPLKISRDSDKNPPDDDDYFLSQTSMFGRRTWTLQTNVPCLYCCFFLTIIWFPFILLHFDWAWSDPPAAAGPAVQPACPGGGRPTVIILPVHRPRYLSPVLAACPPSSLPVLWFSPREKGHCVCVGHGPGG